ncbi:related to Ubiquitin-activating enzyme E1-like [Saccharomycodes ludwigii]|uniref:Related to Ubiquitin-activating enzyme E1-like n=1 Tax=Saccharomycodes ludwigii TaxID=36035 RepID=A0A376B4V3_9ASCO|nr:hypothetical protein SCDLUD_003251 [Saccharomycodes ludwigii]KAH3900279.1 hypothetical protein SCDLUD_003251 [Saccharomycodes ludwigii]SSD59718.1 related to Ubiquitin-activating enzyme E1-like [Saccharomycodes ludwigii]
MIEAVTQRRSNVPKILNAFKNNNTSQHFSKLRDTKLLLVGAGGIGCELLKDLVLLQYGEIHVVDLDTIDLSNLNRQFLFRHRDIKTPKSTTAVKAVEYFNTNTKLVAYQGNIMDPEIFTIDWFNQFDFFVNALDNLQARRYVNKMSQFLNKKLLESGTSGFDGYIQPMVPHLTECFDCTTKELPKTFPVCTIRSTPSQPIHCIVWAKDFLFQQLFTSDTTIENNNNHNFGSTDPKEIERIKNETNELKSLQLEITNTSTNNNINQIIQHLLTKLFVQDIKKLLSIGTLYNNNSRSNNKNKPSPLSQELINDTINKMKINSNNKILKLNNVWDINDNLIRFIEVAHVLIKRYRKLLSLASSSENNNKDNEVCIEFDKDDQDTLEFVATAANLRSFVFNIPILSIFDIKQIAGNIIPAIATTNAIVAGLSSLSSLKFLTSSSTLYSDKDTNDITSNLSIAFTAKAGKLGNNNKYITTTQVTKPNQNCVVCSTVMRGLLKIAEDGNGNGADSCNSIVLSDLIDNLVSKYGYTNAESISIMDINSGRLLYDADFDDLLNKTLIRDLKISNGNILLITDEDGNDAGKFRKPLELYFQICNDNINADHKPSLILPDIELPLVKPLKSISMDETTDINDNKSQIKEYDEDNGVIDIDDSDDELIMDFNGDADEEEEEEEEEGNTTKHSILYDDETDISAETGIEPPTKKTRGEIRQSKDHEDVIIDLD